MDKKTKKEIYREMVMVRKFEEKASEMYEQGKIRGFLHLYIGQEAVASGFMGPIRSDDYVIGAYREHGQALARCAEPRRVMAELYGKSNGVSAGKGGSMHLYDIERRFLGGTAIVGASMPLAAGAGLTIKYMGGDQIVLCFFGDGAANQGAFHESLNIAGVWGLPVLYVCENNGYGMGTALSRVSATSSVYQKAQCYGMETYSVDGMDVEAVYDLTDKCIKEMRKNQRPMFIEAMTYRYRGHSMADPQKYRTKEEVSEWEEKDPINTFGQKLLKEKVLTKKDLEKIDAEVTKEIEEAAQFAEDSPEPAPDDLYTHIYA